MKIDLIMELGNSFFTIYKRNRGLILREPSVIALKKVDKEYKLIAVGKQAKALETIEDESIRVFSPFLAGKVTNFEYAQILVKEFIKMAGLGFSLPKRKALMVVDVDFDVDMLQIYKNLFKKTFIKPAYFVPSIYGILYSSLAEISPQKTYGIYDLGASHTTFGVISGGNKILTAMSLKTGGKDMTLSVKETIKTQYNLNVSFFTAQKAKEELANLTTFDSSITKIKGVDASNFQERMQNIKAEDVKKSIEKHFKHLEKLAEFALDNLTDIEIKQLKVNGMVVGGQVAKTIGFERYLKERLYLPVMLTDELDYSCILGLSKIIDDKDLIKKISFEI